MTQVFRVELEGVDITDDVENTTLTEEINRIYHVSQFSVKNRGNELLNKNVDVYLGDKHFNGFVYDVSTKNEILNTVTCRSQSAKLTEPFSNSEEVTENATTALELCALYSSTYGVPISYQSEDFAFGGSYQRSGTVLQALSNIASVTGSELLFDGTNVIITPNQSVTGINPIHIEDDQYLGFLEEAQSVYAGGVGIVRIQNYSDSDNEVSNNIVLEVDELTGDMYVYTNPVELLLAEQVIGANINSELSDISVSEENTLSGSKTMLTKAPIQSIETVTVNGVGITNYTFTEGYAKVIFSDEVFGLVKITYTAKTQKGTVDTSVTPMGLFFSVDITNKDQQVHLQGFVESSDNAWIGENMRVETSESPLNPEKGFEVYINGGDPELILYVNGILYPQTFVPIINYSLTKTVDLNLVPDVNVNGGYIAKVDNVVDTYLLATSYGRSVPYGTEQIDGIDYFTFAMYYPKIQATYTTVVDKYDIKTPLLNGEAYLTVRDKLNDEIVGFDLQTTDYNNIDELPCKLNQTVNIDIVSETGHTLTECSGVLLLITSPAGIPINTSVRADGFLPIYVTMNGDYIVSTSPITNRNSTIKLIVNVPNP